MKRIVLTFSIMLLSACAADRAVQKKEISGAPIITEEKAAKAPIDKTGPPNGGNFPAFSPDGSRIAFLSSTLHTPADLWVMNADGSDPRRLTTRGASQFAWSRDGKQVFFTARRKGYGEVLAIGADGKGEERMPFLPPNATIPVYSPGGSLFAFTAPDKERTLNLWIGTADGSRVEAVTEKINVRSYFWNPDSQRIYYEAGKSYGVGIWEINLKTMETKNLVNKYLGTPDYSPRAGMLAYPYPTNPGEFEVQTMKDDGSGIRNIKAPRLAGRFLLWDAEGTGVYYLGQDLEKVPEAERRKKEEEPADTGSHKADSAPAEYRPVGSVVLWRLDLATGVERRISPADLHVGSFALSPDRKKAVVAGVLEKSTSAELFLLDLASGAHTPLVGSRASAWMPTPSPDSSKIAFFTNDGGIDALRVAGFAGEELATHLGMLQQSDTRLMWLPESDGFVIYSGTGLYAFTANGPVSFPNAKDLRAFLSADASLQRDEVLISALPAFGQEGGLYKLKVADNKIELVDLRYPTTAEDTPEHGYLQPKWSVDGKKIAFNDGVDIWSMGADNTGRKQLTHFAKENLENKGRIAITSFPVWSVRGDLICFTLKVYEGKEISRQVWLMNADGTGQRPIYSEKLDSQFQVFLPEYTNQPFFTPSDEQVIITEAANGIPNLLAVDVKGGAAHRLTESGAIHPAFVPEEGAIVYTSLDGNRESIWLMNSDGTGKRPFVVKYKAEGKGAPPPAAAEPVKSVEKSAEPVKETTTSVKKATAAEKKPVKKKPAKKPAKKKPAKKPGETPAKKEKDEAKGDAK